LAGARSAVLALLLGLAKGAVRLQLVAHQLLAAFGAAHSLFEEIALTALTGSEFILTR